MEPKILWQHLAEHPSAEPVDAVKFLYQREFGCGHLLADEAACAAGVARELAQTAPDASVPALEALGHGLCRLNLRNPEVRALPPERIARMMRVTEANQQGSHARLMGILEQLRLGCASCGSQPNEAFPLCPPFSLEALDAYLATPWQATLPPRHSARYREAYQPAYRVVLRRYGDALPLLTALEARLAQDGRAMLALDGDCASGKTTLSALLASLYDCNVIHLDDFFLPPAMRTPERLAQPGGNVHYERFSAQVLTPLLLGDPFRYEAFDCHRNTVREIALTPKPVTLVEGSYALHPTLDAAYAALNAVRVRMTLGGAEQLSRIRQRNGDAMLERFRREWIPLEKRYFQAYHSSREDTLILPGDGHPEDAPDEEETREP